MVCCLITPDHYLNQCWLLISEVSHWAGLFSSCIWIIEKITNSSAQVMWWISNLARHLCPILSLDGCHLYWIILHLLTGLRSCWISFGEKSIHVPMIDYLWVSGRAVAFNTIWLDTEWINHWWNILCLCLFVCQTKPMTLENTVSHSVCCI